MTPARRVVVRLAILAAIAGVVAFAARGIVASIVSRKIERVTEAIAEAVRWLPAPRDAVEAPEPPLPPPAPSLASAIASTDPNLAQPPPAPPPGPSSQNDAKAKGAKEKQSANTKKSAPVAQVVTRAEVDDAIATKCHGVRATLVKDEGGAPIGLALHRVGGLARFGVAEGDVLVAANGHPLRTPDEAMAAIGALKDARRVSVALRRGASIYVVTVEIADENGEQK